MSVILREDFRDLARWIPELEPGGAVGVTVAAWGGSLTLDVPKGCTLWLRQELIGPLEISYDARAVSAGGANDRVSDLNCFWMSQDDPTKVKRDGAFASYDTLRCYYVGLGGNANTTTRFRRYVGEKGNRPLLPQHDLSAPEFLLKPNVWQKIKITVNKSRVSYARDGRTLFAYDDPQPYARGWFGLRTVASHLEFSRLRVRSL